VKSVRRLAMSGNIRALTPSPPFSYLRHNSLTSQSSIDSGKYSSLVFLRTASSLQHAPELMLLGTFGR
jgi:hypothetical protein